MPKEGRGGAGEGGSVWCAAPVDQGPLGHQEAVGLSLVSRCPGPRGASGQGPSSHSAAVAAAQGHSGLRAPSARGGRGSSWHRRGGSAAFALLLPQVDLGVALPLITPGKLAATVVTGEGLLARVRADVGREVVTAAEVAHANPTLEGLVPRVDADVPRQLVGSGKAPVTAFCRARVGPLVHWRLARPVGVLARPQNGPQGQMVRVIRGSSSSGCGRAAARQPGSLAASTGPWPCGANSGAPQSKVADSGEWSERRGDSQGVQGTGKGLAVWASCTV